MLVVDFDPTTPGFEQVASGFGFPPSEFAGKFLDDVRTLFREYQSDIGVDLCFQDFGQEIADLPGKYSRPLGRIFLIYTGDATPAGCIALRPLEEGCCEMKRLFVRPEFRRKGLADQLVLSLLDAARSEGYRYMRLDTMRRMTGAIALYERLGFEIRDPYCENPEPDVVYMELPL